MAGVVEMAGHGGSHGHGHRSRGMTEHIAAIQALIERSRWADRAPEEVALEDADGRVLAEGLAAPMPLPRFDDSQMDGYAVRAADTQGGPLHDGGSQADAQTGGAEPGVVELTVAATGAAGHEPAPLAPGTAAPVMTGAPIPVGADAVVPVEEVAPAQFLPDGAVVQVPAEQSRGRFVRPAGSDVARGESVLGAGMVLSPVAIGTIAALGLQRVRVRPALRVGVLTTGDEVVAPGQEPAAAQIHNANAPLLRAQLERMGCRVTAVRHVIDDDDELRRLLASSDFEAPDLWVSSGGISEGAFEVVRRVLGAEPDSEFLHVAMQPGGPQGLAMIDGTAVVCLPGNPVSTWVSAEALLRPALAAAGAGAEAPRTISAACAEDLEWLPGRSRIVRARWDGRQAHRLGGYSSHLLATAAQADALIVLGPGEGSVPAGEPVEVRLL